MKKRQARQQLTKDNYDHARSDDDDSECERPVERREERVISQPKRLASALSDGKNPFATLRRTGAPTAFTPASPLSPSAQKASPSTRDGLTEERDRIVEEVCKLNASLAESVREALRTDAASDLTLLFEQYRSHRHLINVRFGAVKQAYAALSANGHASAMSPPLSQPIPFLPPFPGGTKESRDSTTQAAQAQKAESAAPLSSSKLRATEQTAPATSLGSRFADPFGGSPCQATPLSPSTPALLAQPTGLSVALPLAEATGNSARSGQSATSPLAAPVMPLFAFGGSTMQVTNKGAEAFKVSGISETDASGKAPSTALSFAPGGPRADVWPEKPQPRFAEPLPDTLASIAAPSARNAVAPPEKFDSAAQRSTFTFGQTAFAERPTFSFAKDAAQKESVQPAASQLSAKPLFDFAEPAKAEPESIVPAPFRFDVTGASSLSAPAGVSKNADSGLGANKPTFSFTVPSNPFSALTREAGGSDDDDNGGVESTEPEPLVDRTQLETGAGEEHEVAVASVRCKLFTLDSAGAWRDLGIGLAKVNARKEETEDQNAAGSNRRLLIRAEGTGRVLLNGRLPSGVLVADAPSKKPSELLLMTTATEPPVKYLLRAKDDLASFRQYLQ